jgi:alpha-D-xyloside xylohydrolase
VASPFLRRRAFIGVLAGLLAGAATATGYATLRRRPEDQHVRLGDFTLAIRSEPWQLRLLGPDGRLLLAEAPDEPLGLRLRSGQVVRARRLASASRADDQSGQSVQLVAETDDPRLSVSVEARLLAPRRVRLSLTPQAGADQVGAMLGSVLATPDERFVGFGERFTGVNQRGRTIDVWAEDRRLAAYGESTYAPLPLLLSSGGYSFLLERFERASFDLAASRPDRWSWEQQASTASILVSYGPGLKDLIAHNLQATGAPPLPPMWAFGVCKTAVGGQVEVLGEARRMRDLNIPVSSIFSFDALDSDSNLGWPTVTFAGRHAGPYADAARYTAELHRLGYKALNYLTADFHLDRPNYAEPASHGFFVKQADGRPYIHKEFQESWLDCSDPDAVEWWGIGWRRALETLGWDGGMLDLGELIPTDAVLADGSTGAQSHNRYPLLYARAAWESASRVRPDGDFALLVRSGASGAQRYQSLQWPGDAVMRWEGPDGLQSLVPAALSFGLSGFPYFQAEVAGYVQVDLDHASERELWFRWLQLATWTCALRDHYGDHAHRPIDAWLDAETLSAWRDAARIHNALVPYVYSVAAEAPRTGLPVMRFRALEAPDDPHAWEDDQSYFLGPLFLVAPVVEPGATSRSVYLPPGQWVDYWTDLVYPGGQAVTVAAPLSGGRAPAFVRAGAILPLAPALAFDTLAPSSSPGVRTYAGDLVVRIMPGPTTPGDFTLYDGTRLAWDGAALSVSANAQPRTIDLRLPDGTAYTRRVDGASARLAPSPQPNLHSQPFLNPDVGRPQPPRPILGGSVG